MTAPVPAQGSIRCRVWCNEPDGHHPDAEDLAEAWCRSDEAVVPLALHRDPAEPATTWNAVVYAFDSPTGAAVVEVDVERTDEPGTWMPRLTLHPDEAEALARALLAQAALARREAEDATDDPRDWTVTR